MSFILAYDSDLRRLAMIFNDRHFIVWELNFANIQTRENRLRMKW